ncbi:MAG: lmo0937 family membrane protein [Pirellulaceae bacterium]
MLWTVLLILLIMWALGLGFGVAGNLVHLLLVVALVVLVVQLLQGRRAIL